MSNYKHERQKRRKDADHYVDNKKFYEAMKEYYLLSNGPFKKNQEIQAENKEIDSHNMELKRLNREKESMGLETEELLEHKPLVDMPQIPDYIGDCIQRIANKLANRPNFAKYIFREEMIADAIENCLVYINRYNPEKSTNPFGYFTQITWYAFLRRIEKEKGYLYTKYKMTDEYMTHELSEEDKLQVQKYGSEYTDANMHEFINKYEEKNKIKKKKSKKKK